MVDFQEHLFPSETPLIKRLGKPTPNYCRPTVQEPRHPEHGIWVKASALLNRMTPDDEEAEWWEPGEAWHELSAIVYLLGNIAFATIPNPEYNEKRCAEWRSANPGGQPIQQKKVEWGMSKMVPYNNEEKITVD
jgi:hypothetical protein